ncbi:MAG TPA: hypothetical protein VF453_14590 [Burkholderiaceae bacterium]
MSAQLISNRISLDIPDDDMAAIVAAIQTLEDKLVPHLVDLNPEDRRSLPKMGAKTVDFVSKTLDLTSANELFRPAFVDLGEFERDLAAVGALRKLQQPLSKISDMVGDSLLLSGSEAYAAALACYQVIKSAARLNTPGAMVAAADLASRFPRRVARAKDPQAPTAAPSQPGTGH